MCIRESGSFTKNLSNYPPTSCGFSRNIADDNSSVDFPQSAPFPILSQEKWRVSELCSICIYIIHFDGKILALHLCSLWYLKITKGLFPAPCRLPEGDYQRKGEGFQVRTLRLCYRLVPGEAALGASARGKLPSTKCRVRGREASRLGWHSRIPKHSRLAGFERMKAGPQKSCCGDCLHIKIQHAEGR